MKRGEQYRITYKPKELFHKLFHKKLCPQCKSKMNVEREKSYEGQASPLFGSTSGRSFQKLDVVNITEYYCCPTCEKKFTIAELAEWEYE